MAVARETVRLGLAARGHGKLKVRQPLRAAGRGRGGRGARGDRADRATSCSTSSTSRSCASSSEAGELGSYEVKPNYRALGPRFGKQMPQVAAAVEALEPAHVAGALRDGGRVAISVDGHDHELGADDLSLAMQPLEGYQLEREGSHAVALELELDDELRREGLAREVVHAVQNARKAAGLEVEDRIELVLGGDEELLGAARDARGLRRAGDARDERRLRRRGGRRGGDDRRPPPAGGRRARIRLPPARRASSFLAARLRRASGLRRRTLTGGDVTPAPARSRPRGASSASRPGCAWRPGRCGRAAASGSP